MYQLDHDEVKLFYSGSQCWNAYVRSALEENPDSLLKTSIRLRVLIDELTDSFDLENYLLPPELHFEWIDFNGLHFKIPNSPISGNLFEKISFLNCANFTFSSLGKVGSLSIENSPTEEYSLENRFGSLIKQISISNLHGQGDGKTKIGQAGNLNFENLICERIAVIGQGTKSDCRKGIAIKLLGTTARNVAVSNTQCSMIFFEENTTTDLSIGRCITRELNILEPLPKTIRVTDCEVEYVTEIASYKKISEVHQLNLQNSRFSGAFYLNKLDLPREAVFENLEFDRIADFSDATFREFPNFTSSKLANITIFPKLSDFTVPKNWSAKTDREKTIIYHRINFLRLHSKDMLLREEQGKFSALLLRLKRIAGEERHVNWFLSGAYDLTYNYGTNILRSICALLITFFPLRLLSP